MERQGASEYVRGHGFTAEVLAMKWRSTEYESVYGPIGQCFSEFRSMGYVRTKSHGWTCPACQSKPNLS